MKKLVLILSLFIGVALNANHKIENANYKIDNKVSEKSLEMINPYECWDKADEAEARYCGDVGCSFDYWAGYFEGCIAN